MIILPGKTSRHHIRLVIEDHRIRLKAPCLRKLKGLGVRVARATAVVRYQG